MIQPLKYYFDDGSHVIFEKYTIDTNGVIKNKNTGHILKRFKNGEYNRCSVRDYNGKKRNILIGPAILSTFAGRPPSQAHTADHKDGNPNNDILENLHWLDRPGQNINQVRSETQKSAFIIVKDNHERTVNEWFDNLKREKNPFGRVYTTGMIIYYAQTKQYGFSYKEYPDIEGEVWKEIIGSKTTRGRWEISNMNRVKYITKHAENVLSDERLCLMNGYPRFVLGNCHVIAFATFFPEDWANKKPEEIVKHAKDNKLDFRPHMLQLGTHRENANEAYDNGKHDGKTCARMKCASYINGMLEKEHISQSDATRYLKSIGFEKACSKSIGQALKAYLKEEILTRYGRTWKTI